jgi:NAD(P)-dependent dehydrogenase (short-subunit alcohol dehydrogenase family)
MKLKDRVTVITGGAKGIGLAYGRRFVKEGAPVVIGDVDDKAGAMAVAALEKEGGKALYIRCDVTKKAEVDAMFDAAVKKFGHVDCCIANAGIVNDGNFLDLKEEDFDRVMAVNVKGVFLLARHALAAMRDGGSLIINSSVVGLTSDPGICAYATSKHALVGLMRTAAKEVAARGIRVNTLHPGPVDNRFQHTIEVTATGQDEAGAAAIFEEMIPLRRHATPAEVAHAALFLAGDDCTFLTGATVPVDGGMSV